MKEEIIFIIILIIIIILFKSGYFPLENSINKTTNKICFKENCFNIEIANDNLERQKGLMFREKLCPDCGMLFVFEQEDNYKFWMKNTLIPLDIIYMDKNFVIQYVDYDALPCKIEDCSFYSPPKEIKSKYVLEVNSGVARKFGLKISEKMVLK